MGAHEAVVGEEQEVEQDEEPSCSKRLFAKPAWSHNAEDT